MVKSLETTSISKAIQYNKINVSVHQNVCNFIVAKTFFEVYHWDMKLNLVQIIPNLIEINHLTALCMKEKII